MRRPSAETAWRCLVIAMIRQALRDLSNSTWREDAAYWLAHEGREWAMMIDLDTTVFAKGKSNEKKRRSRYRRRRSNGRSSDGIS